MSATDPAPEAVPSVPDADVEALAMRHVMDFAVTIAALLAGRCDGQQAVSTTVAQVERIIAAKVAEAEQRGAVKALREAAVSWYANRSEDDPTLIYSEARDEWVETTAWLRDRADRIEAQS